MTERAIAELCINTIRTLSIDAVEKANSGHPGLPMGAAPMAYVLWQRHLRHNPRNPAWPDRDRFVLSAGHGSMLVYSLLHLTGYDLPLDELENFRQWGSSTPGHPECFMTPGVEATTGPLGQGAANAVGMAMAERFLAARYNRPGHAIVDHHTFALVSDGDLMEGVVSEASSLAGHLGLGKLIYLYDDNDVTLDGPSSMSFSGEDVAARYRSYGWHVQRVEDGDRDIDAIDAAISAARAETGKPSIILIKTTIGFGSPAKAGTADAHGAPLGKDEVAAAKKALGWEAPGDFFIPDQALEHFRGAVGRGQRQEAEWQERFDAWAAAFPELAAEWELAFSRQLPAGWDEELPTFEAGSKVATRSAGGKALGAISARVPWLFGGDADLGSSTKTVIEGGGSFDGRTGAGRNIHFGVREHAMGSICNGLEHHGGVRPFGATFFCFSDYMRPAVRLAAMNEQPVVFVWTHDSIGLGEDGPTHQPVEHLMALRAIPNLYVVRPGDANEAVEAWRFAMERTGGPTALVMTRQNLLTLDRERLAPAAGLKRGAYVVADDGGVPDAILIATGSELELAMAAREKLASAGKRVRVVSMPCWEQFQAEPESYRREVLPPVVRARVAIEAGATLGWWKWVGDAGEVIGLDRFGASAPGAVTMQKLGFTADRVVEATLEVLSRLSS
jgi:transketolase